LSIPSIQTPPKWTTLSAQLDFEAEVGIAKFFIGSDFKEFASIGISEIPNQIKVAFLSSSSFVGYDPKEDVRIGQSINQLVPWNI
ncbi:MAG: hypothetical protein EZS28_033578, partial [Streblomastix strix]